MRSCSGFVLVAILGFAAFTAEAHQPVMDMAPRWVGGYGVQARYELLHARKKKEFEGRARFDRFGRPRCR